MVVFKMRSYYYRIILFFLIILSYFLLIQPGTVFGDYYMISDNVIENNLEHSTLIAESQIDNQVNLKVFDKSFLPIIITSVIVIGVLIFAMWQTIRSRKQF